MVVATLLLETQSTVTAGMGSRLVQVDVHFGMSEMLVAACARDDSFCALDDRLLSDQVDGPAWVDNLGGILEAHISVIILVVFLKRDVNKMLFNHSQATKIDSTHLASVCHLSALFGGAQGGGLGSDQPSASPVAQLWQAGEFSKTRHFFKSKLFSSRLG